MTHTSSYNLNHYPLTPKQLRLFRLIGNGSSATGKAKLLSQCDRLNHPYFFFTLLVQMQKAKMEKWIRLEMGVRPG